FLQSFAASAATAMGGAGGLTVSVDSGGSYDVFVPDLQWHFTGNTGAPLVNIVVAPGADAVGSYSEISFDFVSDAIRHAAFRSYGNHQAVLFTVLYPSAAPNTFSFPNWNQFPRNLDHVMYSGI